MHRLFIAPIIWFALVLSAYGVSTEIPVTPSNIDHYKYGFSISAKDTKDGMAFHVTITAKPGTNDIPSDSAADLKVVAHTPDGETTIRAMEPAIKVAVKNDKRIWEADFTILNELLKKSGLCFVFTEIAHTTIDGKSVAMPSADFYEIKLRDFFKLPPVDPLTQQQIDERILNWRSPFYVHRVEKAVHDESWLKIPETKKPAGMEPPVVRRYVWVSGKSGIAFYVTAAFAQDASEAKMLFTNYWARISMNRGGTPEYGADEIIRFEDRHLVARWGNIVVGIISSSEYASSEMPKLMQTLQKMLATEK